MPYRFNQMKHRRFFNQKQKQLIWLRQNGRCGYCGGSTDNSAECYHHVLRYSDNGATNLNNGVLLCDVCHEFVHDAGHFNTALLLPRSEFKYANWQYTVQDNLIDSRTEYSDSVLNTVEQYWQQEKTIIKTAKSRRTRLIKHIKNQLTSNDSRTTMSAADTYEHHLRLLQEAKQTLATLKRYVIEMEHNYKNQINASASAGFVQNYTEQLKLRHQHFAVKIEQLTQLIERHTRQIALDEEKIQHLIQMAQRNN